MDAYISGGTGIAVLTGGEGLTFFHVSTPETHEPLRPNELHRLVGDTQDIRKLENTSPKEAAQALQRDYSCVCALDLALMTLDRDLSPETRRDTADALDELISDTALSDYLHSIFSAAPLPFAADLKGAQVASSGQLTRFWQELADRQPAIVAVCKAWNALPAGLFDSPQQQEEFHRTAVGKGLFRDLVKAYAGANVNLFLVQTLKDLPRYREVLQRWVEPLRSPMQQQPTVSEEREPLRERRTRRVPRVTAAEALEPVIRRKAAIVHALDRRDLEYSGELIADLVNYQREHGRPEHLSMSLCDLAIEAKRRGLHSVQLELTGKAIEVNPADGWAWAQHADALLAFGRFEEALRANAEALACGPFETRIVAQTGRAEVLKAMGKFREALAAYDEVRLTHPESVVVQTGRAEVLKAMGKLPEALAAFDEVRLAHPESVIVQTGRAEVLKAMGQLPAALAAYDNVRIVHPQDVVAQTGRAELLKTLGKLPEALAAYDEARLAHPENAVAQTGRAELLKTMGKLPEALAAYDEIRLAHPENAVAQTGRAELLKTMGKLPEALAAYDEIRLAHPRDVVAQNGRAEVLKAIGKLPDALAAYDEVRLAHPHDVVAQNGRAEVLKAMGKLSEALAAYDGIRLAHPQDVVAQTGRAEVLKAMGKLSEALAAYDEIRLAHPQDVVAQNGRAEALRAMGRLPEALAMYDEVRLAHLENVVAQSGRAEVLKAMGKLPDALAAYDEVRLAHPQDVVAQSGRAGVLKAMGKLPDALAAYDEVCLAHPQDVVAQNGRAEVLKAMGRLSEALAAYDEIRLAHPQDVVTQNGRAEVLKAMGKLPDALAAYDEVRLAHPENVVTQAGMAEVLKAMGKLPEALAAYDEIRLAHPENVVAQNGRSCMLALLGRHEEALLDLPHQDSATHNWIGFHIRGMILLRSDLIDESVRIFKYGAEHCPIAESTEYFRTALVLAMTSQRRYRDALQELDKIVLPKLAPQTNVIRLHLYGALKEKDGANAAYASVKKHGFRIASDLVDELHWQFILERAPRQSERWVRRREVDTLLLAA
jgi:tetratricopeptide (TPR) repeat protein